VQDAQYALGAKSRRSSFMISTPSTKTSRAYTSSQTFTYAEMDQQLGALMSDEPIWNAASDPFAISIPGEEPYSQPSLPRNNSSKLDAWESSLYIDDVVVCPFPGKLFSCLVHKWTASVIEFMNSFCFTRLLSWQVIVEDTSL
jgi:hypothetical protein